jgi:hypothetical protein
MKLYSSGQDLNDFKDYKDFFDSFVLNNQNDNYDQINNQNLNRSSITFGIYCYWWANIKIKGNYDKIIRYHK